MFKRNNVTSKLSLYNKYINNQIQVNAGSSMDSKEHVICDQRHLFGISWLGSTKADTYSGGRDVNHRRNEYGNVCDNYIALGGDEITEFPIDITKHT